MPAPARSSSLRSRKSRRKPSRSPSIKLPVKAAAAAAVEVPNRPPRNPNGSTQGWSNDQRRNEIHRIFGYLTEDLGLTKGEANEFLVGRTGFGINTVHGWASYRDADAKGDRDRPSRAPPAWPLLDLLRYELGLAPVRDLVAEIKARRTAKQGIIQESQSP